MRLEALVLGFLTIGLLGGCGRPPAAELAQAESAVNAAEQAGAADYAEMQFQSAMDALADAKARMQDKDYRDALTAALDAKQKAESALKAVPAGKEAARFRAGRDITALESKLAVLRETLKNVRGAAAADLAEEVLLFEDDWTRVKEDNLNGNYAKVLAAIPAAEARVVRLMAKADEAARSGRRVTPRSKR